MNNPRRVRRRERRRNRREHRGRARDRDELGFGQFFLERTAVEPLHGDERDAIISSAGVEDIRDVLVGESSHGSGLALEAREHAVIEDGDVRLKDFDRYAAVDGQMPSAVDRSHPADAHQPVETITLREDAADQMVRIGQRQAFAIVHAESLAETIRALTAEAPLGSDGRF